MPLARRQRGVDTLKAMRSEGSALASERIGQAEHLADADNAAPSQRAAAVTMHVVTLDLLYRAVCCMRDGVSLREPGQVRPWHISLILNTEIASPLFPRDLN